MSFTDAISTLTEPQLREIIKLRRAVPLATFLAANGKARQACALRHKGWMEVSNVYVNAMIVACHKTGLRDALDMSTLMSATESFSIGMIAREDLTLDEHNLLIKCIAEIATPEIILQEQNWTPDPLPQSQAVARQYFETLKEKDEKRGRGKSKERDLDPDGDLADTGIDPALAIKALLGGAKKVVEKVESKISKEDMIARMLAAVKKPAETPIEEWRIVTKEDGCYLQSSNNERKGPFLKPAEAVVFAVRNKLKLG